MRHCFSRIFTYLTPTSAGWFSEHHGSSIRERACKVVEVYVNKKLFVDREAFPRVPKRSRSPRRVLFSMTAFLPFSSRPSSIRTASPAYGPDKITGSLLLRRRSLVEIFSERIYDTSATEGAAEEHRIPNYLLRGRVQS